MNPPLRMTGFRKRLAILLMMTANFGCAGCCAAPLVLKVLVIVGTAVVTTVVGKLTELYLDRLFTPDRPQVGQFIQDPLNADRATLTEAEFRNESGKTVRMTNVPLVREAGTNRWKVDPAFAPKIQEKFR